MSWQPIETAPKDRPILVFMPRETERAGRIHHALKATTLNGTTWFIGHLFGFDLSAPTHWMPLPDAPEQGS